ncbi:MAG: hypothetical protein EXS31_09845, partial [Pedosphaera sp.]|nr:hypothetical protein [Pedosphaera sp.]
LSFARPSSAVQFALALQLATIQPLTCRMGIHLGEVVNAKAAEPREQFGEPLVICERLLQLAKPARLLMSRAVFDSARPVLKREEVSALSGLQELHELSWLNHGPYLLEGIADAVEICEVAAAGQKAGGPPTTSAKAQRQAVPGEEQVLGWRPAVGQSVPNTKWVLERKLGEGGFGEVWLGRHETLKEQRVFKFCFRADRVRSLKREVTLFRLLKEKVGQHPNIVGIQEVFFDAPPFYIVMDYEAGQDLRGWWEAQGGTDKVPIETRLEIVAQVADALQAAHEAGVIHRDVKPSNILVATVGGTSSVSALNTSGTGGERLGPRITRPSEREQGGSTFVAKLTDFGIGQVVSQEVLAGITKSGFTQTIIAESSSSQTGSQMYMAPELLAGKPASTRSDIYSLGVVLYQLLVGDLTRPLTTDWADHIADPLLRDDLKHCFAGNPQDRFAGAGELAANLRELPRRQAARRELLIAERSLQRRRRITLLASGCAVVLLLLSVAMGYGLRRALKSELEARQLLYASDMRLAYHAWEKDQFDRALQLLDQHRPKPGQKTDQRGWEWRLLWQLCQFDEIFTLGSHSNNINAAVFSPKGDFLATAGGDQTVRLWDTVSKREAAVLKHDAAVRKLAFLPDGKTLTTLSADGTLHSWDFAAAREVVRVAVGPKTGVGSFALSADGGLVAMSEVNGNLNVWDEFGKTKIAAFSDRPARSMSFSPDGTLLATGYRDNNLVKVWDLKAKQFLFALTNRANLILDIAFSHDGKMLASAVADDRSIHVWDLATRKIKWTLTGHTLAAWQVAFLTGDKIVASSSSDRTVKLWSLETGRETTTLHGYLNEIFVMAVAPDGLTVATGIKVGTVSLSSTTPMLQKQVSRNSSVEIPPDHSEMLSHDGSTLLMLHPDHRIGVWDTATITERFRLDLNMTNRMWAVSRTGRLIAVGQSSGAVKLFETSTMREIATLTGKCWGDGSLVFSPDEKKLAWVTVDHQVRVSEIATQQTVAEFATRTSQVWSLTFSPDGTMIGAGFGDGRSEIFQITNGRRLALLEGHNGPISGVVFLHDGETVATSSWDQTVKLWDLKTARELKSFGGQPLVYWTLALSPDGRRLATGGGDGTIQMWDTATHQEVITLKRDADDIFSLAFSPDGTTLFAAGCEIKGKRTLSTQVWRAPSLEEIDSREKAARR